MMSAEAMGSNFSSDDVRYGSADIFAILWKGRISLFAITFLITSIVAAAAFLLPPRYDAVVLMMPVSDMEASDRAGAGSSAGAIGGLASLAGLSAGGSSLKSEALAMLESEILTDRFIEENKLLPILYDKQWDSVRKQWKTQDPKRVPTLWKANRLFKGLRTVVDNPRTGLITLTISWRDPQQAANWANQIVAMTNEYIRNKTVDEAERSITFLEDQGRHSTIVTMQEAIANLTESQLRKVMLARTREQYALKVLDPATVPERQAFPRPVLWIGSAFIGGLFLAVLFVLLRASGPAKSPQNPSASQR